MLGKEQKVQVIGLRTNSKTIDMPRLTPQERTNRAGRFTASEISKLITYASGKSKEREWGATALGYIHKKFQETVTGKPMESFSSVKTDFGHLHEGYAFTFFELEYGLSVEDIGFQEYDIHSGATPDGFLRERNATMQVKCPYNPEIHKKYIERIKDAADLKKVCKAYYWQMVFEMMATRVTRSLFVSFDPRNTKTPLHVVDVPLVFEHRDEILMELNRAIEYKEKLWRTYRKIYYSDYGKTA